MRKEAEKGFILPISVILMLMLTISGLNFMQLDYLERRMMRHELDNHTAFYLASAGIERALESFKPTPPDYTYTVMLQASTVANDSHGLCTQSDGIWRGCLIPPFGPTVINGLPFEGDFNDGTYEVRAFNNMTEPVGTVDTDRKLTYRARAEVNGEIKLLELREVQAATGMRIINCENSDSTSPCPDDAPNPNVEIENIEGREPSSTPAIPTLNEAFYRNAANLPCNGNVAPPLPDGTILVDDLPNSPNEVQMNSGTCYYSTGNVTIKGTGGSWNDVVVFSDKVLTVTSSTTLTDSILIGLQNIELSGVDNPEIRISSPKTENAVYPVLVSNGTIITKDNASADIVGNVFAKDGVKIEGSSSNNVEGSIIAGEVKMGNNYAFVTDFHDGSHDVRYYGFMPGFTYPTELIVNEATADNSWDEIQ